MSADTDINPWITISEAATRLGKSTDTVRRWGRTDKLPSLRVDGRVLVSREAVEALSVPRLPSELLTVPEAGVRLRVSDKTVRRMIDRGELEVVRGDFSNSTIFVRRESVERHRREIRRAHFAGRL